MRAMFVIWSRFLNSFWRVCSAFFRHIAFVVASNVSQQTWYDLDQIVENYVERLLKCELQSQKRVDRIWYVDLFTKLTHTFLFSKGLIVLRALQNPVNAKLALTSHRSPLAMKCLSLNHPSLWTFCSKYLYNQICTIRHYLTEKF